MERFTWAVGIEDTFIAEPIRWSGKILDEYVLTQHDASGVRTSTELRRSA